MKEGDVIFGGCMYTKVRNCVPCFPKILLPTFHKNERLPGWPYPNWLFIYWSIPYLHTQAYTTVLKYLLVAGFSQTFSWALLCKESQACVWGTYSLVEQVKVRVERSRRINPEMLSAPPEIWIEKSVERTAKARVIERSRNCLSFSPTR